MSQIFGTSREPGVLTDREIAEDILTSQKYISNYYYAPAILESMDPKLRSTFEQVHSNTQAQAKQVFDYLNAKGWYEPRQADPQSVSDLRNAAQESRQVFSSITGNKESSETGGKSTMIGGQNIYSPESTASNLPGSGWQSQSYQTGSGWQQPQSQSYQTVGGWQSHPQSYQTGTGWQPTYSQTPQWTGTQAGEGQSGMGPSSLSQWTRWGGQPSWMQSTGSPSGTYGSQGIGSQATGYGGYGSYGTGTLTGGWQSQPQSFQTGTGWQPTYSQTPQWTGTQAGEGQSGMGPSSLSQWTRWGGQPSWMQPQTGTQLR